MIQKTLTPIADELGPVRLTGLQHTFGVMIGTEAIIACTDVLHLNPDVAGADSRWACRQLVPAALTEAGIACSEHGRTSPDVVCRSARPKDVGGRGFRAWAGSAGARTG